MKRRHFLKLTAVPLVTVALAPVLMAHLNASVAGDSIKAGYTGTMAFDTGYFYCPYVPVMYHPKGIMNDMSGPLVKFNTRYGITYMMSTYIKQYTKRAPYRPASSSGR